MSIPALVFLAIAVLIILWAVGTYNGLVRLKNTIANAFAQIDVQLKRRYDLIPNLVETAKKYMSHEQDTLVAVTSARAHASVAAAAVRAEPANAAAAGALGAAEQGLQGSLNQLFGRLSAVAESYPEFKADQTMRDLSEELTSTENKVGFARQAYNDAVLDYNNATEQFPSALIARIFSFAPAGMLQSTQSAQERETVRVQF